MENQSFNIIDEYFKSQENCHYLECKKVIFDSTAKQEWFFEDGIWCYFSFNCEDNEYRLRKQEIKDFSENCKIRDMSYEIKMLLGFHRLRGVVTIEKEIFSKYISQYEQAREFEPELTIEEFNFDLIEKEEIALEKSGKIVNFILAGCLLMIISTILLFLIGIFFYFSK